MAGLNVGNVVNVSVNLAPKAASGKNFGVLGIFGPTDVITPGRWKKYGGIEEVALDFGQSDPEYSAALTYFAQNPQPQECVIARWVKTASRGGINGGIIKATLEQFKSTFTASSTGSFTVTVNGGTARNITGVNLSAAANLTGIADALTAAINEGISAEDDKVEVSVVATSNGNYFKVLSKKTGVGSTVSNFGDGKLAQWLGLGTLPTVNPEENGVAYAEIYGGVNAESPVDAIANLDDRMPDFYMVSFTDLTDVEEIKNVAKYCEASSNPHLFGVTVTDASVKNTSFIEGTDLATELKKLALNRTVVQYSSENSYAVNSIFGRMATVNFDGQSTAITLKFKQEPGVTYEIIGKAEADNIKSKNCNVFVYYNNDTSIIQEGVTSSGAFIDEIHNLDALSADLQTELYNALYTQPTKIPQTDAGYQVLKTVATRVLNKYVGNGVLRTNATWNLAAVGGLNSGDLMSSGYYVYVPSANDVSQADRENRRLTMVCAVALSGAVHFVNATINVMR